MSCFEIEYNSKTVSIDANNVSAFGFCTGDKVIATLENGIEGEISTLLGVDSDGNLYASSHLKDILLLANIFDFLDDKIKFELQKPNQQKPNQQESKIFDEEEIDSSSCDFCKNKKNKNKHNESDYDCEDNCKFCKQLKESKNNCNDGKDCIYCNRDRNTLLFETEYLAKKYLEENSNNNSNSNNNNNGNETRESVKQSQDTINDIMEKFEKNVNINTNENANVNTHQKQENQIKSEKKPETESQKKSVHFENDTDSDSSVSSDSSDSSDSDTDECVTTNDTCGDSDDDDDGNENKKEKEVEETNDILNKKTTCNFSTTQQITKTFPSCDPNQMMIIPVKINPEECQVYFDEMQSFKKEKEDQIFDIKSREESLIILPPSNETQLKMQKLMENTKEEELLQQMEMEKENRIKKVENLVREAHGVGRVRWYETNYQSRVNQKRQNLKEEEKENHAKEIENLSKEAKEVGRRCWYKTNYQTSCKTQKGRNLMEEAEEVGRKTWLQNRKMQYKNSQKEEKPELDSIIATPTSNTKNMFIIKACDTGKNFAFHTIAFRYGIKTEDIIRPPNGIFENLLLLEKSLSWLLETIYDCKMGKDVPSDEQLVIIEDFGFILPFNLSYYQEIRQCIKEKKVSEEFIKIFKNRFFQAEYNCITLFLDTMKLFELAELCALFFLFKDTLCQAFFYMCVYSCGDEYKQLANNLLNHINPKDLIDKKNEIVAILKIDSPIKASKKFMQMLLFT